jgi:hypothetical protein
MYLQSASTSSQISTPICLFVNPFAILGKKTAFN